MQSIGIIYDWTLCQGCAFEFMCTVGHPKRPDETADQEKTALEQDDSFWQDTKFLTQN